MIEPKTKEQREALGLSESAKTNQKKDGFEIFHQWIWMFYAVVFMACFASSCCK